MKATAEYVVRTLVDWIVRKRSTGLFLVRLGGGLLIAAMTGSFAADITLLDPEGGYRIAVTAGESGALLVLGTSSLGAFLIAIGLVLILRDRIHQRRFAERKRIIVVELRGLRDFNGSSLAASLPDSLPGRRDELLIDLRKGTQENVISSPTKAVQELSTLPLELSRRESGIDRADLTVVFGGLAAVPLTFLAGSLLDDESNVLTWDWDRHRGDWRTLEQGDDEQPVSISGLGHLTKGGKEVALAVSFSYAIDTPSVADQFPRVPIIELSLKPPTIDAHWYEGKQQRFGEEFLRLVNRIASDRVERIHLFLAAPSSVVFRLGRLYDQRNLPELVVYQYERDQQTRYPWGIQMPTPGGSVAVKFTNENTIDGSEGKDRVVNQ